MLLGAAAGLASTSGSASAALPDLVSEAAGDPYVQEYFDGRLLLRFDGYVTNRGGAGVGPLEIRASNPNGADVMRDVFQWRDVTSPGVGGEYVRPPAGTAPTVVFESNDDHNHYHLKDAAEYSLWNSDETAQVALAQKTEAGFCIEDTDPGGGDYDVGTHNFCWQDHETWGQTVLVMGISPGFRDVYNSGLSFQWVDVSDVPPGVYRLASRVDPRNVLTESDESNNGRVFRNATVPGHLAQPISADRPEDGSPVAMTLASRSFGTPGPRRYTIVSAPRHGSLNRAVGSVFTGSTVTYTPNPGYRGSDSFTYAALDANSDFPRMPAPAAATIVGDDVAVSISGAPAELVVGLGAQLSATVANGTGGVTWSVGGIPGGGSGLGTISASGLYVAPGTPPPDGEVTVAATSIDDPSASASATIRIVPRPAVAAAPDTMCAEVPSRRESAGSGRITRSARQLLINQRISQSAVRRANAIEAWLAAGIQSRDLCGGSIGAQLLGPGVQAGPSASPNGLVPAVPRPLPDASGARRSGDRVTLSTRQMLINQRISQAAIRRLNGLRTRLDGRLTGGDLGLQAVRAGKLATDIRILAADIAVPRPAPSRTTIAPPKRSAVRALPVTAKQFRINQKISQAAVRRANALADELAAGLRARHFAEDTVVAVNIAPELRP